MDTRNRLGLMLILLVLATSCQGLARGDSPENDEAKKNVIVLLADDLGWGDVGFQGGNAETPNLDQFARQGVRFSRFYAYPACSPARAALLTGRFPHRYGIYGPVRPRDEGLPLDELVIPSCFQKAGYKTSLIGKWHLGTPGGEKGHPMNRGFDHFYGFMNASIDYFEHTSTRGKLDWQRDGKTVEEEGYSTDLLSDEAVRQINAHEGKTPFCMVVAFNAPHGPFQAPKKLVDQYRVRMTERRATYAAMLTSLDAAIGRILTALNEKKLGRETIVVFTSDNGAPPLGSNGPFRGGKRQVYEGGIRVPCVIRLPGVLKAGSSTDQLSAIHDLFPTLATACGVSLPTDHRPLDGRDLWPTLVTGKTLRRSLVIAETDYALFQDEWKLIQPAKGKAELYDLRSDAEEADDLADGRPEIVAKLKAELDAYKQKVARDEQVGDTRVSPSHESPLADADCVGDVVFGMLGDPRVESNGRGLRLLSCEDRNDDERHAGEATMIFQGVDANHRWYRLSISGLAQDAFDVEKGNLYLKVEFFKDKGTDSLGTVQKRIYSQIERERKDLRDKGTNKNLGLATWRSYAMDFRTPFAEIDALKLSVGFAGGLGKPKQSEFWVRSLRVNPIDVPKDYARPIADSRDHPQPALDSLVPLGGRWYFDPKGEERTLPKQFDRTNADQLLYKTDRFIAPFAGNTTSWLRKGHLDLEGNTVDKDRFVPDNLVITVTKTHIVLHSKNLPNHPTASFPDRWRLLDGNPSYIKEQEMTWHLPIEPVVDPKHVAMNERNENGALPMGPIGVATNGVIFFNPFDHIFEDDAVWRLDRCCGHPSPRHQYHYHKYPVCVKTPWSDEGLSHSTVIGFAFDGFPVYGPYEAEGVLAKDNKANPLNAFNLHEDDRRGPHYHVTPGKFPHIIGGYWGKREQLNRPARRGTPR